jgi:hypothetical protein
MSRASWWRAGFALLCAVWWLEKLIWSNPGNQWDFRVYYHAAQAWRAGLNPYDPAVLPATLASEGLKFSYPPFALALFAPITALPIDRAAMLFLAVKVAALCWIVQLWSRLLRTSVIDPLWVLVLVFAYSSTIFVDFAAGSITTFEQCLLWLGFCALLRARYWTFVAAVVAASLLRIAPIVLLAVCLAIPDRRRLRFVFAGGAVFVAVFLATYAASPGLTTAFAESVTRNVGERGHVNPALLPLVTDALAVLGTRFAVATGSSAELLVYFLIAASIVAATTFAARRAAASTAPHRLEVVLYLLLLAYALVMPRFKNYHYMLLIVPTFYIATRSTRLREAVPLLVLACLPIFSWITSEQNLRLLAEYSQWLIALGAWGLFLYEINGGTLLTAEAS